VPGYHVQTHGESPGAIAMMFDQWKTKAALAAHFYGIDLDRVSKPPLAASSSITNVVAAQPQHNMTGIPRRVKRA
jgi:hypothetical protein